MYQRDMLIRLYNKSSNPSKGVKLFKKNFDVYFHEVRWNLQQLIAIIKTRKHVSVKHNNTKKIQNKPLFYQNLPSIGQKSARKTLIVKSKILAFFAFWNFHNLNEKAMANPKIMRKNAKNEKINRYLPYGHSLLDP